VATKQHNQMTGADLHPNALDGTTGTELSVASRAIYDTRYGFRNPTFTVAPSGTAADYNTTGTNDQTVVQSAIDAVAASGGGRVLLRNGTYNFSAGTNLTLGGKAVSIIGEGYGTIIKNLATSSSAANSLFNITGAVTVGADFIEIGNFQMQGNATGGMGIRLNSCYQGVVQPILGKSFTAGSGWGVVLWLNASIDMTIINPVLTGNSYAGMQFGGSSNANTIIGGWIYGQPSGGAGIRSGSSNKNTFIGTIIETNTDYGAVVAGGRYTQFINCWIENNGNTGLYCDELSTVIDGCWFTLNTLDIDVRATQTDMQVLNNRFNDGGKITLRSGAAGVNIHDNINLTTLTDNGATGLSVKNNGAFNPDVLYAQDNVTGAITFNRANGSTITATLTGNITPTLTNGKALNDTLTLKLTQDATGSRTVTWPSNFKKAGGALTLSTGVSAIDVIQMRWDGTNWVEVSRAINLS